MVRSLIEAHLFENMEEDEECDYDHALIDDSSAQDGDKSNCSVGEDDSNMCNDVVIETESMQSQAINDSHEDVKLQSELRHALDVLIDEHEKWWNALSMMNQEQTYRGPGYYVGWMKDILIYSNSLSPCHDTLPKAWQQWLSQW